LGDRAAAKQSYQRAREFARSPDEIVLVEGKLGDIAFLSGDYATALASYQRAAPILEAAVQKTPQQFDVWPPAVNSWYRIGLTQSQMAKVQESLESYKHELALADQEVALFPKSREARKGQAMTIQHVGDAWLQLGNASEALAQFQKSLEIYEELRKSRPDSPPLQRLEDTVYTSEADSLRRLGQWRQAELMYKKALSITDSLVRNDASSEQYQTDRNGILLKLSDVENVLGHTGEARQFAEQALDKARLRIGKSSPSASDLYQYCYDLVTTPFADLRDPPTALRLAQQIVQLTGGKDPGMLDMLARAWEQNGNLDQAIVQEKSALARYPQSEPIIPGTERAEMKQRLEEYQRRRSTRLETTTRAAPKPQKKP
jgi:tetratricopeptide (TPR) repeat protein